MKLIDPAWALSERDSQALAWNDVKPELRDWFEPIPSEAGLHLAARIRDPALSDAVFARARTHVPGAMSAGEYSREPMPRPALTFGYGVIDAEEIRPALQRFARALEG